METGNINKVKAQRVNLSTKFIFLAFLLTFLFLFNLTLISADKPVTQVNTGPTGLQVFYPEFESVKQSSSFNLHLHVSNISTGLQIPNTQVSCNLHLYNSTGSHTFESGVLAKDSNGWDHEIYLNGNPGNFSDLGTHGFYIWCNTTTQGGEAKGVFEVTPTGVLSSIGFYIILLLLSLGIVMFGYSVQDYWVVILGSFALVLFGLYVILFGIVDIKDTVYTYGIGIITLMLGAYFGIRASMEQL